MAAARQHHDVHDAQLRARGQVRAAVAIAAEPEVTGVVVEPHGESAVSPRPEATPGSSVEAARAETGEGI